MSTTTLYSFMLSEIVIPNSNIKHIFNTSILGFVSGCAKLYTTCLCMFRRHSYYTLKVLLHIKFILQLQRGVHNSNIHTRSTSSQSVI